MLVETLVLGPLDTNTYIVSDAEGQETILIDPAAEPEVIRRQLNGRNVAAVLLTHGHFDHTGALAAFADRPIYLHPADAAMLRDPHLSLAGMVGDTAPRPASAQDVREGDVLTLAGLTVQVLHTPGHTPGSVTYRIQDALFTGDTMFRASYGRTDFPGGNPAEMRASLQRLRALPGDLPVYPGHGIRTSLSMERWS